MSYLIPAVLAVVVGLVVAFLGPLRSQDVGYIGHLNKFEFAVYAVVCLPLIWGVGTIASNMAVSHAIEGYHEFWNGSIVSAESQRIPCERDGNCQHTYRCDPYIVNEPRTRQVPDGVDSEGHIKYRTEHYTVPVTHYHHCPYTTVEWSYWLNDSFGSRHDISLHRFEESPQPFRDRGIPGDVPRGVPQRWEDARQRIANGDPPPATRVNNYANFLLAADDSILREAEADIERYREDGLLPDHTAEWRSPIHDDYLADKFRAVGGVTIPGGEDVWQDAVMQFNAALGTDLQGDMHMVAVPADAVDNPDAYTTALKAYWQSDEFGKWALPKNAVILVVGLSADGNTVDWVRAETGMPVGNGEMRTALSFIRDVPFEPESFLGHPRAVVENGEITNFVHGDGVVEQIVFVDHPFKRACMGCDDPEDEGTGFTYLEADVKVPTHVHVISAIISLIICFGILFGLAITDPFKRDESGQDDDYQFNRSNPFRY